MKIAEQSMYLYIQNIFNKICQIKEFECAQKDKKNPQIINFWNEVLEKSLLLMKQIKQIAVLDRDKKSLLSSKKYKRCFNDMAYQDIALLFAADRKRSSVFEEKRKYLNYALCAAYHPFVIFGEEIKEKEDIFNKEDVFAEKNRIFTIAKKMQMLEFILITQSDINKRLSAVQEIFCETEN